MATFKFGNNAFRIVDGKITTAATPDVDAGGLCLQQNAGTGAIQSYKSSSVSHGMTSIAEDDTYAISYKETNAEGGLFIRGLTSGAIGYRIHSYATTEDTTTTTASTGAITLRSLLKSGTAGGTLGATGNILVVGNSTTGRYIFNGAGTAYADVAWTTFSDERLKTDQEDLEYGLTEILNLEPKRYTRYSGHFEEGEVVFDGDGWDSIGFLAQDVKEIIPEAVPINSDPTKSFYGLTYIKLIPVLVNAIKELEARVASLEA